MAKASQLQITQRIETLKPLLIDGLTVREIRALTLKQTDWGPHVSEAQLKRYLRRARQEIAAETHFDFQQEFAKAMRRNERVLARASSSSDLRTYLAANKAQCQLLQLAPPPAQTDLDIAAARRRLAEEVAAALAEGELAEEESDEHTDS